MAITTLLCYAHQDERMIRQFKNHLSLLEHNGHIILWDNGRINPGADWKQEINTHLDEAQIILLFISSSFLASHYCYTIEMQRAVARHERKEVRVILILLRPVHWNEPPLDKLQVLPDQAKPVSQWSSQDKGFTNVVEGIITVINQWNTQSFSDSLERRRMLREQLDQLLATVTSHMQPQPRALAVAHTLQQLSIFIPNDVTLTDLVIGWQILSHSSYLEEDPAVSRRRATCGELAMLASQFTPLQGNLDQAIHTWRIWNNAFNNSSDPRQVAMAKTFARELTELQEAAGAH